jgi:hypothetical protein
LSSREEIEPRMARMDADERRSYPRPSAPSAVKNSGITLRKLRPFLMVGTAEAIEVAEISLFACNRASREGTNPRGFTTLIPGLRFFPLRPLQCYLEESCCDLTPRRSASGDSFDIESIGRKRFGKIIHCVKIFNPIFGSLPKAARFDQFVNDGADIIGGIDAPADLFLPIPLWDTRLAHFAGRPADKKLALMNELWQNQSIKGQTSVNIGTKFTL